MIALQEKKAAFLSKAKKLIGKEVVRLVGGNGILLEDEAGADD